MAEKKAKAPAAKAEKPRAKKAEPASAPKASAKPAAKKAEKPTPAPTPARPADPSTVNVVTADNEKIRELKLSAAVFGTKVNDHLLYEAVKQYRAGARRGTHMTKNRALVSGSGKKPWRQKGTGRARVGEIRNPLWRKGGTVFGPQPRSYEYQLPKKVEKGALRAALAAKLQGGAVIVVDALSASEVKTKAAVGMLKAIGGPRSLPAIRVDAGWQGAPRRRQSRREAGSLGAQRARRGAAAEQPDHRARRGGHKDGRRHAGGAGEAGSRARLTMMSA